MKRNILICILFAIIDRLASQIMTLTIPVNTEGILPTTYTCNSSMYAASPPLTWNTSSILLKLTQEFMVTMSTVDIFNNMDFNWGKYKIPSYLSNLEENTTVGVYAGVGKSDIHPLFSYQPPCSSGPGWFNYTFSIYALSEVIPYNSSALAKDLVQYVTNNNLVLSKGSITLKTCHFNCISVPKKK